jgi:hypothetical protein
MGRINIGHSSDGDVVITEDGWLRLGFGNFDQQVLAAKVTIDGNTNPVQVTVNGDKPISADIDARLAADANLTANVGGTGTPLKLAPIEFKFSRMQIKPDIEIKFSLFGISICAIRIAGNTDFTSAPE